MSMLSGKLNSIDTEVLALEIGNAEIVIRLGGSSGKAQQMLELLS
ncbi:MAG: hypothetical protein ACOYT8_06850 [Candidatus Dependentiae bacterium]